MKHLAVLLSLCGFLFSGLALADWHIEKEIAIKAGAIYGSSSVLFASQQGQFENGFDTIRRSLDNGRTWSNEIQIVQLENSGEFADFKVSDIFVDSQVPGRIYLAGRFGPWNNMGGSQDVAFVSHDNGNSFQKIFQGEKYFCCGQLPNIKRLANGPIVISSTSMHAIVVVASYDEGRSWSNISPADTFTYSGSSRGNMFDFDSTGAVLVTQSRSDYLLKQDPAIPNAWSQISFNMKPKSVYRVSGMNVFGTRDASSNHDIFAVYGMKCKDLSALDCLPRDNENILEWSFDAGRSWTMIKAKDLALHYTHQGSAMDIRTVFAKGKLLDRQTPVFLAASVSAKMSGSEMDESSLICETKSIFRMSWKCQNLKHSQWLGYSFDKSGKVSVFTSAKNEAGKSTLMIWKK